MATAGDRRGPGPERAYVCPLPPAGEVRLGPEESRHLVRVRRVAAGSEVVLFDGRGGSPARGSSGRTPGARCSRWGSPTPPS